MHSVWQVKYNDHLKYILEGFTNIHVLIATHSHFLLSGLNKNEANLPKKSVVNVSQVVTVDKNDLVEKIGTLTPKRLEQILDGIRLITEPKEIL